MIQPVCSAPLFLICRRIDRLIYLSSLARDLCIIIAVKHHISKVIQLLQILHFLPVRIITVFLCYRLFKLPDLSITEKQHPLCHDLRFQYLVSDLLCQTVLIKRFITGQMQVLRHLPQRIFCLFKKESFDIRMPGLLFLHIAPEDFLHDIPFHLPRRIFQHAPQKIQIRIASFLSALCLFH